MAAKKSAKKKATNRTQDPMILRAKELYAKQIAKVISEANEGEGMTQMEAGVRMGVAPTQVSLIVTGKLHGFSTDNLLLCLAKLGHNVTTTVSPSTSKSGKIAAVIG